MGEKSGRAERASLAAAAAGGRGAGRRSMVYGKDGRLPMMRFARSLAFLLGVTLGLAMVAVGVYTVYVARLWFRAMRT